MLDRRTLCGFLFFTKALFAFLVGCGGLGYQAYMIAKMYKPSSGNRLVPVHIPDPTSPDSTRCFFNPAIGTARLEPPPGSFILGISLDWKNDKVSDLNNRLGQKVLLFNSFITIDTTGYEADIILWNGQQARDVGAMLELTLRPSVPVETIPTTVLWSLANTLRTVNSDYGVPILLRFGHEMNGGWMVGYGMRPIEYKTMFATLATYVRLNTNMTAMLWSPNVGNEYPFGYATPSADAPQIPLPGTPNFLQLDTNGNGQLDNGDDPYLPFYPGDEYVDWVGISVYDYSDNQNTFQIMPVTPDVFVTPGQMSITGTGSVNDLKNFYDRFVTSSGKPFLFSETGAAYQVGPSVISTNSGVDQVQYEVSVKRSWWNAIFQNALAANGKLARMRAAVWFEESKWELDGGITAPLNRTVWRDYRLTSNATVVNALRTDLANLGTKLAWAGKLVLGCNGTLSF